MLNFDRLRKLRKENGFTQEYMAKKLGIDRTTYGKYETYNVQPANDILINIANIFGVTTDYLLGRVDNPTSPNKKAPPENREGRIIYNKLVEMGAIKDGDEITDKQIDALFEYFSNNKDYVRFVIEKNK